jgi:hypothetical protein
VAYVRVARNRGALKIDHARRAVSAGADWVGFVEFYLLPVVDIRTERPLNRVSIGRKAVR